MSRRTDRSRRPEGDGPGRPGPPDRGIASPARSTPSARERPRENGEPYVVLKAATEPAADTDGARVLVDGSWPRGVRKNDLAIRVWLRVIAPSPPLRRKLARDPVGFFEEFRRRYLVELRARERRIALESLRRLARIEPVTLVFSAKDHERNGAVVLRDALIERRG